MKINAQTPKIALNKAFLKQRPIRNEIETFKANLKNLLAKVETRESEENKKNHVRDFLLETYYKTTNEVNTKDRKDLVIHLGKTNQDKVGVIIEAKTFENKAEMLRLDKLNAKAFHELVLYYFDERIGQDNAELKNLIITNTYEWFIFDANVFDKQFYRNTPIKKLYETYKNDKKDNPFFYEELRKLLDNVDETIDCVYFNLKNYETFLHNDDLADDKNLIELQKIFSTFHLLKTPFTNDSNSLNKPFYDELLHIIGLEEIKDKSKTIIRRKLEGNRNQGSLLENAITILQTKDSLRKVKNVADYGENSDERYFNVALELCITWINRILFLKLLESQLVGYHKGNKDYRFLNVETIPDFDELFTLFHQVLAKTLFDRSDNIKAKFVRVPYLNSSLFEISELEDATISIESLKDTTELPFINSTVLKDLRTQGKTLHTIEYLFKFLDAYDFASEGVEAIQENNRSLINASILGKIFEKINGYKDGSIFTPSFITMYMCRQSIRLAVAQKFKEKYAVDIDSFDDLKNFAKTHKIRQIKEYNAVVNSIKLCDPAVGSGHFLVSSLNEIIAIKSELGILADENGDTFSDYEIHIENDELIITDERGEFFAYQINDDGKPTAKAQRLQKTLFHEKQMLIENCLFGVDINPNSVKICRLRLWIELLKNAYYVQSSNFSLPDGEARRKHAQAWTQNCSELETLPNIDINIKCGNSLISRFALDADLSRILKQIKYNVNDYRSFVLGYKETKDREKKREFEENIRQIKDDFKTQLFFFSPERRKFADLENQLRASESKQFLFGETDEEKDKRLKVETDLQTKIAKAKDAIKQVEENAIYRNAFEWRFEFPEVLDNDGNFLGFDIVIGNPPYIDSETMVNLGQEHLRDFISKNYETAKGNWDIYIPFIEKGIKISDKTGFLTYITPDKWISKPFGEATRETYLKNINSIVMTGRDAFESAVVDSIVTLFSKLSDEKICVSKLSDEKVKQINEVEKTIIKKPFALDFLFSDNLHLLIKIEQNTQMFSEFLKCENACATSDAYKLKPFVIDKILNDEEAGNYFKVINTGTTGKYASKYGLREMTYLGDKYKFPVVLKKDFENNFGNSYFDKSNKPKLIIKGLTLLDACLDEFGNVIPGKSTLVITGVEIEKLKFALSLINSKLWIYYISDKYSASSYNKGTTFTKDMINNFPIPQITPEEQQPFIESVDKILEKKKRGEETSDLEKTIDAMVYKLYELTADEIGIVENGK